jgi:hypothetical protein
MPTNARLARCITVALLSFCAVCARGQSSSQSPPQPLLVPSTANDIPRVPGPLTIQPMNFKDQARFYLRHTYDPVSLLLPALPAAILLADPPKKYSREWKDGGPAFGRNFGDALAVQTAANTGKFLTCALVHEDPRYFPDTRHGAAHRILHALSFTVVDRSTEGNPRLAVSNFAGAAAGGFIGRLYLPPGYSDNVHTSQRVGGLYVGYVPTQLVGYATNNLVSEFTPEFKALARALHLPFVH